MKVDKFKDSEIWEDYLDEEVEKHSGKPFKSGMLIEVPRRLTTNPRSGKPGFLFSDGNIVDCHQVKLVEDNDSRREFYRRAAERGWGIKPTTMKRMVEFIKQHHDRMSPEEKQHIIDLGEKFKKEDESKG